jgi:hypothetical protein
LLENSDSLVLGTSIAGNSNIDFSGPCLVYRDLTWSNYTVRARIIPSDDAGHGLLLRYQDPTNFYRISLCGAASDPTGRPPAGLSIQKVVAGFWQEVFRETAPQHVPNPNTPYELSATIRDQLLFVRLTADPDNVSQTFSYGPVPISSLVLERGGIGLFSWGMTQTAFEFVRVESLTALQIAQLRLTGSTLTLAVENPSGWPYDVESAANLGNAVWTSVLSKQTAAEVAVPLPASGSSSFWRLKATQ